jgi:hypothetical protein
VKTLSQVSLVEHQASPGTIIAMVTNRPLWTAQQVEHYKDEYRLKNQVPYPMQVLAGMGYAFLMGVEMLYAAARWGFERLSVVDDYDGIPPFMGVSVKLKEFSEGKVWRRSSLNSKRIYTHGSYLRTLPEPVGAMVDQISQVLPVSDMHVHSFGLDPILEITMMSPDGTVLTFYPLVWDIDVDGNVVFIDPPTE